METSIVKAFWITQNIYRDRATPLGEGINFSQKVNRLILLMLFQCTEPAPCNIDLGRWEESKNLNALVDEKLNEPV